MDTTDDMTIGKRLRQFRHDRGWSIAELARAARLTESTIYRLEAEDRQPRADTLQAISDALSVSADELLGLDIAHYQTDEASWTMLELPHVTSLTAGNDVGEMIPVPARFIPDGLDHDRLAVISVTDDLLSPMVQHDDLAIVIRMHPDLELSDGDFVVVKGDDGSTPVVRRAIRLDRGVLVMSDDPRENQRLPRTDLWGLVVGIWRRTWHPS